MMTNAATRALADAFDDIAKTANAKIDQIAVAIDNLDDLKQRQLDAARMKYEDEVQRIELAFKEAIVALKAARGGHQLIARKCDDGNGPEEADDEKAAA